MRRKPLSATACDGRKRLRFCAEMLMRNKQKNDYFCSRKNTNSLMLPDDWSKYYTRTVVYRTYGLTAEELKQGYDWACREFYSWDNILKASFGHDNLQQQLAHLFFIWVVGRSLNRFGLS